jgi:hypothetical protein
MKEMSGKKRTPPQDWIQDYYSPVLSVLASQVLFWPKITSQFSF